MLTRCYGDVLAADSDALVCPVNCVGVMGAGLAEQVRYQYPAVCRAYRLACQQHQLGPGRVLVLPTEAPGRPGWVVALPTKRHWRDQSRLDDLDAGLAALAVAVRAHGFASVAVPALGCGRGGLAWVDVEPRIHTALAGLAEDVEVRVFAPFAGRPYERRLVEVLPLLGRATGQVAAALTVIGPCEHLLDGQVLRWPATPVTPDDALVAAEAIGHVRAHVVSLCAQLHGMPEQLAARLLNEWDRLFDAVKDYANGRSDHAEVTGRARQCAGTADWLTSGRGRDDLRAYW